MRTLRALSEEPSPASLPHAGQRVVPFPPKKPETDKASCESPPQKIFFFDTKKEKSRFQGRTTQFLLNFVLMFIVVEGRG